MAKLACATPMPRFPAASCSPRVRRLCAPRANHSVRPARITRFDDLQIRGARHSTRPSRMSSTRRPRRLAIQELKEPPHDYPAPTSSRRTFRIHASGERAVSAQLSPEMSCASSSTATPRPPGSSTRVVAPTISTCPHSARLGPASALTTTERGQRRRGVIGYTIDALSLRGRWRPSWRGTSARRRRDRQRTDLYRTSGGLLRSTRHALIRTTPSDDPLGAKPPGQPKAGS